MLERSARISKLKSDRHSRESYIKAKLGVLVPSQIRALRLKSSTPNQKELAKAAGTHQSRVSKIEQPGEANLTIEKLAWIASVHKVGLIVKFVPFSEMLQWENNYSQDRFNVTRLDDDEAFLNPGKTAQDTYFRAVYYVDTAEKAVNLRIPILTGANRVTVSGDTVITVPTRVPAKDEFKRVEKVA